MKKNLATLLISALFSIVLANGAEKEIIGYTAKGDAIACESSNQEPKGVYNSCSINDNSEGIDITFNTSIKIYSGWNTIGITHPIENIESFLSASCIISARVSKDGNWYEYNAFNKYNTIDKLESNDALFIYSSGECELNSYGIKRFKKGEINIQNVKKLPDEIETKNAHQSTIEEILPTPQPIIITPQKEPQNLDQIGDNVFKKGDRKTAIQESDNTNPTPKEPIKKTSDNRTKKEIINSLPKPPKKDMF